MNNELLSSSSVSNVKKKHDQSYYELQLYLLGFFPLFSGLLAYSFHSLYFQQQTTSMISSRRRNTMIFQFFNLSFIFLCSNLFTASLVFSNSKPTNSSLFKTHVIISLWLGLAMVGINIVCSVIPSLVTNPLISMDNSFSFPEYAEYSFVLFLVMNSYVLVFYILAATDRLWVFEPAYSFSDMKWWIDFAKGKYLVASVVLCGLFGIGFVIESGSVVQKVIVFIFVNGNACIVYVIMKKVFNVLAPVWKDIMEK